MRSVGDSRSGCSAILPGGLGGVLPGDGPLTPERHIWACALAVQRQYGERSPLHVAERLGALALAGDAEGVAMWQAIAARLDALAVGQDPAIRVS